MKTVPLGELCEVSVGRTPARAEATFWGRGHPWLSIADMSQGDVITRTKEQITDAGARTGKQVQPGTVLLSFKLSIGKVARAGIPLYTNEAIAALPIKDASLLDEAYLLRALNSMDLAGGSNRAAMGATLNKAALQAVPIPLPSLDEQRRIAAILCHADDLRAGRRQVLAHFDALTHSIFHDMFGDPDAFSDTVPFGDIASLFAGRNLVADDSELKSDFRVLKISAVTTGQFKPGECKPLPADYVPPSSHLVRPGDLLMSRANTTELVGAVAYVEDAPDNLALPDKIWRFEWRSPASVPIFYHALFRTMSVRRRISRLASGTGGSMKNVSKSKLVSLPLPNVPIAQQRTFADRVAQVRTHRVLAIGSHTAFEELFSSLQSRAFRGAL